jgi:outer membrane protein assembly factor BamB
MRLFVIASMLFACSLAARAEWPQFRGPDGGGHSTASGLPTRWGETDNVAWKTAVDGLGWSSPVVRDDRVYCTTATPVAADEQSLCLVCLDARTGAQRFRKELFRQTGTVPMHKKNSHASPTPLIDGGNVFVHFGPHGTACVTLEGDIVWKRTLDYQPVHGNGGSPALAGDVLVICCDGGDVQYVAGLDRKSGDIRWKTDRDTKPKKGFSFATPLAITAFGVEQVVCPGSDAVFSYDPQTGREIWRVDYPDGYSVTPRPVFGAGLVFVASGYDKPVLYAIDPTGKGNVTDTHVKWRMDRGAPLTPSVLVVGEELYCVADNGVACCVDARTGTERWRERLGGNFSASPLHANGLVYFQNESGEAIVVKAGRTFEEVARNQLGNGERTFASYAVDGNSLLIRSETAVYRIGSGR